MSARGASRAARARPARDAGDRASDAQDDGLAIDLHVVVEYGLNLAEVAATIRSRVAYEVERLTGLPSRGRGAHRGRPERLHEELDRARELARAALATLEASRRRIDDLNVYPVPDGDTGTNLDADRARDRRGARETSTATDRAGAREGAHARGADGRARQLGRDPSPDRPRRRRGARRARSRSTPTALARAFRAASDAAYRAVRRPVEGTMLTVIRELAEEAERRETRSLDAAELLAALVAPRRGVRSRGRRSMLAVLARGRRRRRGRRRPARDRARARRRARRRDARPAGGAEPRGRSASTRSTRSSRATATAPSSSSRATRSTRDALEGELEPLGDSLLVVGDASALKVHVHTDDPGRALSLGVARGTIDGVEIAEHAPADDRARGAAARRPCRTRR